MLYEVITRDEEGAGDQHGVDLAVDPDGRPQHHAPQAGVGPEANLGGRHRLGHHEPRRDESSYNFV